MRSRFSVVGVDYLPGSKAPVALAGAIQLEIDEQAERGRDLVHVIACQGGAVLILRDPDSTQAGSGAG